MPPPDLATIRTSDLPIRDLLAAAGTIFRTDFPNDSGNEVFGMQCAGLRFFVKHSLQPDHVAAFRRVEALYRRIRHATLPPLRNAFPTPGGYALVFDWLDAEHLPDDAVRARFAALPLRERVSAFESVLDLHVLLEAAGFVAEDLYDGCLLYDFASRRTYVCDLDEYHAGPFTLDRARTLGSTRFMAPEEWVRGSRIDHRTTVCNLGRLGAVLLGDRMGSRSSFAGDPAMQAVLDRATQPQPHNRFAAVVELAAAWRAATSGRSTVH